VDFRGCVTFADLAHHYAEHELVEPTESIHPKAHTTIRAYERALRNRLLPRWGNRVALSVEPLEVEQWLTSLKGQEGLPIQRSTRCAVLCRWSTGTANVTGSFLEIRSRTPCASSVARPPASTKR
jgi:hypothetical protein